MNNPTDEQIMERLARSCGWKPKDDSDTRFMGFRLWWENESEITTFSNLPAFLASTDAIRPVLEKLSEDQWGNLCQKLQSKAKAGVRTMAEHYLTIPPATLARAIYEAIGEAG